MIKTAALPKLTEQIEVEALVKLPQLSSHNVCNPSVIAKNGKLLAIYKGINYDLELGSYRATYAGYKVPFSDSQNYFAELDPNLNVLSVSFVEDRHIRAQSFALQGLQDLRMFSYKDKIWCMGVAITHESLGKAEDDVKIERVILCELNRGRLLPLAIMPSRQVREKNWMPWVKGDDLYAIYAQDPYEVFHINGSKISQAFCPGDKEALTGQFGGSCVISWKDKFIGVIHRKHKGRILADGTTKKLMYYTHSFIVYSQNFEILAVSPPFTFEGQRIEFCAGIALFEHSIVFSYGIWDKNAMLLKAPLESVINALGLSSLL